MIVNTFKQDPQFWSVQIIFKITNSVGCPSHLTIASKLLRIKTCWDGVFWVFHGIFSIIRRLSREPDFSAKKSDFQKFLKMPQSVVCVLWVFQRILALFDIWAENRNFEPRTGFSKNSLKNPQNMFSWCFLSVSRYFSIVRHLSREPDFWAENRIFKNFLKSLKTCLVDVFWVFQGILA